MASTMVTMATRNKTRNKEKSIMKKMMKKYKRKVYTLLMAILIVVVTISNTSAVSLAVDAMTLFGSAAYAIEKDDEVFPIGVYIKAGDVIGAYHLEVAYDASKLRYVSGALVDNGGVLVIEGVGGDVSIRNFLYFQAIDTGNTSLSFVGAAASNLDGTEMYNVVSLASAPITITEPAEVLEEPEDEDEPEEVAEEDETTAAEDEDIVDEEDIEEPVEEVVEDTTEEVVEEVVIPEETIEESASVNEAAVSAPDITNDQPVKGNYDYLFVPFIVILSSILLIIFVVILVINIKRKKFEEALNNEHIEYDFEFETFSDENKTITAEEVEEKLVSTSDDGELETIDIDSLDMDEYGDIDYLE